MPYGGPYGFDVGGFIQAMLGGPLPPQYAQIVRNAMQERGRYGTSKGTYVPSADSPAYDSPAPIDNSAAVAAAAQAAADSVTMSLPWRPRSSKTMKPMPNLTPT